MAIQHDHALLGRAESLAAGGRIRIAELVLWTGRWRVPRAPVRGELGEYLARLAIGQPFKRRREDEVILVLLASA